MNTRSWALLAAGGATMIYGLNHTVAKVVMPVYVGAFGFIFIRTAGAAILFWLLSLVLPKEKIERVDYLRLFLAALMGMCINMLSFFKGLELSTPVNSGIFATTNPIIILLLSYLFLSEKIGMRKFLGITMGFAGALILVLYGTQNTASAPNILLGNILFMVNSVFFSAFIIVVKPLSEKYNTVTIMKWLFLIGFILTFPITIGEYFEVEWSTMPYDILWRIVFVVLGTTFSTYLLNLYALKNLQASTVGAFAYAQPVIAIGYAVYTGNDVLDGVKTLACLIIMLGVYLVSKKPLKTNNKAKTI
ncbi:MAG: DMT family transporter [Flavobacteriaceae bacterium]|nr:DMT family transporter [Flavobacteriaceae bacterium]